MLLAVMILLDIQIFAQNHEATESIKTDINHNNIVDDIHASNNKILIDIDHKKFTLSYELLGFEHLSELSFKKGVLVISGYNDGTGAYTWTYKFRANKAGKMELIGYDDFNKWVSGNITTSFNAITGIFKVMNQEYNHDSNVMETTKHTGKLQWPKMFLTSLTQKDITKLQNINAPYMPK